AAAGRLPSTICKTVPGLASPTSTPGGKLSGPSTTVDQRGVELRRHLQGPPVVEPLSPMEELAAAAVVADGRAAENELAALAGAPMLDLEAVAQLRDRVRHSGAAREHLIASCRPLVVSLA